MKRLLEPKLIEANINPACYKKLQVLRGLEFRIIPDPSTFCNSGSGSQ